MTEELNIIPEDKKNDFLWILQNRIFRIFNIITEYGEENFYQSFSGGKDSVVLHHLIDMAVPDNKIPRVYADTGIEYRDIRKFVMDMAETDGRIQIIKPTKNIRRTLEEEGYPFKSKKHSEALADYQKSGKSKYIRHYLGEFEEGEKPWTFQSHYCPDSLRYQFTPDFQIKVSDHCCLRMKEDPLKNWQKENNKPISIIGLTRDEGGRRESAKCTVFTKLGKLRSFQPLVPVTKEWEDWFIDRYNIKLCRLYYPPFNFSRTGCKGCPFAPKLQEELETLHQYLPSEREQCEIIWKPVYQEYRRIGYRLKDEEQLEFSDLDFAPPGIE